MSRLAEQAVIFILAVYEWRTMMDRDKNMLNMDALANMLDDAVERGDLTEEEAREEFMEECSEFWRRVNDDYWER